MNNVMSLCQRGSRWKECEKEKHRQEGSGSTKMIMATIFSYYEGVLFIVILAVHGAYYTVQNMTKYSKDKTWEN